MDVFSLIRFIFVLFMITSSSVFLFCHSVFKNSYYLLKNSFIYFTVLADLIFYLCEGQEW